MALAEFCHLVASLLPSVIPREVVSLVKPRKELVYFSGWLGLCLRNSLLVHLFAALIALLGLSPWNLLWKASSFPILRSGSISWALVEKASLRGVKEWNQGYDVGFPLHPMAGGKAMTFLVGTPHLHLFFFACLEPRRSYERGMRGRSMAGGLISSNSSHHSFHSAFLQFCGS